MTNSFVPRDWQERFVRDYQRKIKTEKKKIFSWKLVLRQEKRQEQYIFTISSKKVKVGILGFLRM